jgi:hypothetical protein
LLPDPDESFFYDDNLEYTPCQYETTASIHMSTNSSQPLHVPNHNMASLQHNLALPGLTASHPTASAPSQDRNQSHIAGLLQQLREAGYPFPFPPELQLTAQPRQEQPASRMFGTAGENATLQDSPADDDADDSQGWDREEGELSDVDETQTLENHVGDYAAPVGQGTMGRHTLSHTEAEHGPSRGADSPPQGMWLSDVKQPLLA